jgi:hypothetical protein
MKYIQDIIKSMELAVEREQGNPMSYLQLPMYTVETILAALKQSSPIPWPEEAAWSKAPIGAYARAVDKNGACYFYLMAFDIDRHGGETQYCGVIEDMTGIDWEKSLEFNPSLKSEQV